MAGRYGVVAALPEQPGLAALLAATGIISF